MGRLLAVVALFAVLGCSGLHAQTIMTANIPFDFQVGKTVLPAGEYRINCSSNLLIFQGNDRHSSALVLASPADRRKPTDNGVLLFHRYGNSYFLSSVWGANSADGVTIMKTPREKELARLATAVALRAH